MKINETGDPRYYKVTLRDTIRIHVKAHFIRFIANVDGLCWVLRNKLRK